MRLSDWLSVFQQFADFKKLAEMEDAEALLHQHSRQWQRQLSECDLGQKCHSLSEQRGDEC
jgi:hypothetical protein